MSVSIPRGYCIFNYFVYVVVTACIYPSAAAQETQEEIAELKTDIESLTLRLAEMELAEEKRRNTVDPEGNPVFSRVHADADRPVGGMTFMADFRLRYEQIDDDKLSHPRDRARIRTRAGLEARINQDWAVTLGLATGKNNPVSANQTIGDGGITKEIGLDLAYFEFSGIDNVTIAGGKYENIFYKAGEHNLIFDSDYRPEGLALSYDVGRLFLNAGSMFLESDDLGNNQDKEMLWGLQLGIEAELDGSTVVVGASHYNVSASGSLPFHDAESYNNTLTDGGVFLNDYESTELFADIKTQINSMPLRIFVSYVTNLAAEIDDVGYALGGILGHLSGKGTWELSYAYQELESDAVFGGFTDSDFAGGGTDNNGSLFDYRYRVAEKTSLGITYYLNSYGEANHDYRIDYNRFHVYIALQF